MPIVRGWFVATRFKIEMFADRAPVSPSNAILLVRLSANKDADQRPASTPARNPTRS